MKASKVFNGPIEVGLRSLAVLLEAYPDGLDLQRLVTLDYLLVHSGDLQGGPTSLHPPSPLRSGEVTIRRGLIENGLHLYACRGLLTRGIAPDGIRYFAEDEAGGFLDAMKSTYVGLLRSRAEWVFASFGLLSDEALQRVLNESLDRWRTEFAVLEGEEDGT
jgi:hypothetical protein